jgi:hypothetical protein
MPQISDFSVGQWVVAMTSPGVPCQCNTRFSPEHRCRVLIEKVGQTKVHGRMSGGDNLVAMAISFDDPHRRGLVAVPLEEAKRLYRKQLESYDHPRVDELVEKL